MQQEFAENLMDFEKIISSASTGDGLSLRHFLGFEREYAHLGDLTKALQPSYEVKISSLSTKSRSYLSMLLLTYHTLNIAASLARDCHIDPPPMVGKSIGQNTTLFDQLQNWPNLLDNFKQAICRKSPSSGLPNTSPFATNASISNKAAPLNRHIEVLKNLMSLRAATTGLINIQVAVIGLHRLLTEARINQTGSAFSNEDMGFLAGFCSNTGKLELPLRMALFISPLLLLLPKRLHKAKRRTDIYEIMEAGKMLGNRRPPLLLRVEKEIFTTLFRLATEDIDIFTEMKDCVNRLPWEDLNVANDESSWFQPEGGSIPSSSLGPTSYPGSDQDSPPAEGENNLGSHKPASSSQAARPQAKESTSFIGSLPPAHPGSETPSSQATRPEESRSARQPHNTVADGGEDHQMSVDTDQQNSNDEDQSMIVEDETQLSGVRPQIKLVAPEGGPSGKGTGKKPRPQVPSQDQEEENMDVDEDLDTLDTCTRPRKPKQLPVPSQSQADKTLGKRKDAPIIHWHNTYPRTKREKVQAKFPSVGLPVTHGSSADVPIDIDHDELFTKVPTTLDIKDTPKKYKGETIQGYGPSGAVYEFTPELHVKEDLSFLKGFDEAIKTGFVDGRPLHIADPEKSAFRVMTETEFEELPVEEILEIYRRKHIIVTEIGLSTLSGLSNLTDIQDQSIDRDPLTKLYPNRLRQGTVRTLLVSSQEHGKILNALHFPMGEKGMELWPFSMDSAAWIATKGGIGCAQEEVPPMADFRWGTAATTGALSWLHLDSNGLGTYIDPKTGLTWWIVLRKKGDGHRFESCSDTEGFFNGKYEVHEPNADNWDVEAVVLHPGTRLIMRPNTPHAVFTVEHSICHGGHFYATSAMVDTMFAIITTFVSPLALTNTDHPKHSYCIFLRRIAGFYHETLVQNRLEDGEYEPGHVPKLTDFDSVLNLLAFCNLMILANVLDHRTYERVGGVIEENSTGLYHDVNSIPAKERYEMAYARGRCWDILHWFFNSYEIFNKESGDAVDGFNLVAMRYLAQQGSAIIDFKRKAVESKIEEGSNFSVTDVATQIMFCFQNFKDIPEITPADPDTVVSLAFPDPQRYGVRSLVPLEPYNSPENLLECGTTKGDEMFFLYLRSARGH